MDWPSDYHTKWSKSGREREISYDIAYMCTLKNDTNKLTYKTEKGTDLQGSSMFLQMAGFHSFYAWAVFHYTSIYLSISIYIDITSFSSIHSLIDTWVISISVI